MKLLVTGGCGFIGSNFIRYWFSKHPRDTIVNLDALTYAGHPESLKDTRKRKGYSFVRGDITKPEDVKKAIDKGVDGIIHFAAESHVDRSIYGPLKFVETNVLGTAVLLEAARTKSVPRFLYVSTDEVYGELALHSNKQFTYSTPYAPRSPYAASKAAGDHLVRSYYTTYGMDAVITNCSNNIGPYQDPEKFIPLSITNVLDGKPIRVYGNGINIRDWLWVEDHCRGIELAFLKGKKGETYLFGGKGPEKNNLEIAKMILRKLGKKVVVKKENEDGSATIHLVGDRPGHDLRYRVEWSRSKKELGWEPTLSLDDILDKTIKWYSENRWWWEPIKQRKSGVVVRHRIEK